MEIMISAKILADSINGNPGPRLVTWELEYPRFIHAQLMTHRQFSRNAQSSRAIPTNRLIERIRMNPAGPIEWGLNQKGMRADSIIEDEDLIVDLNCDWLRQAEDNIKWINETQDFYKINIHKQVINRLLEPWLHIKVIVSSTFHENWFHLRLSEHAQPEIRELAKQMHDLYYAGIPIIMKRGQWHLPLVTQEEKSSFDIEQQKMISVARCARVSYLNHDGENDPYKDMQLHDQLACNGHWSAFEHIATPAYDPYSMCGNFRGWEQYRKSFPNECISDQFIKIENNFWKYLDA